MNARQLQTLLAKSGYSQRRAAREIDINERTMRKYVAGDAPIPRTVALSLERLSMKQEHETLLAEMKQTGAAMRAPHRKFSALARGKRTEHPTAEDFQMAVAVFERLNKTRQRLEQFLDEKLQGEQEVT
jgi:hypothetical protein